MADIDLQTVNSSGDLSGVNLGGTASADKVLKKSEIDAGYQDILGNTAIPKTKLTPTATAPTYAEGQYYYSSVSKTFNYQGPFAGIEVSPGHGNHIHIINNTGATIFAGTAVGPAGISGGKLQIQKAIADSFDNARVIGIAIIDIPDGDESAVATSGILSNLDTTGLPLGTPMYLSDTVAGTYTSTPPAIRTLIGGILVVDGSAGIMNVAITNSKSIPSVLGRLQGQTTGVYSVTTTAQDIIDYTDETEIVTTVDAATGQITLPNDGEYRVNFTAAISFPSTTTTRSVTLELYDVTGATIHFPYVKNIPRDATEDSLSFSWPITESAANVHKIRIKSSVAITVTFNEISFDIESISII